MVFINAEEFGIVPQEEIGEKLTQLLSYAAAVEGEKTIIFKKGIYHIDSDNCKEKLLYITNTAGDGEYAKDETPHLNKVAFYLEGISDMILDGGGSEFIIDGKASNMAVVACENIVIKNLLISHSHPDMHELKVVDKALFHVDFELDKDSLYEVRDGRLFFNGKGYQVAADKNAKTASWIGLIRKETPHKVSRTGHPLARSFKIRDMGEGRLRVGYAATGKFRIGDCFYIYGVRRQYVGILVDKSKGIRLEGVGQSFNYSLALVAQDSEDITLDSLDFSPGKDSGRKLASVADFIQLCMCRGKITVKNSYFDGAGDDCLNVHGIHFIIKEKKENEIKLRFMHPQTHGFNPLRVGDEIAFINPDSLLEEGRAVILKSELINERDILLTVDNAEKAAVGYAVEDISACPELDFIGNKVTRIITRGLLITTRGRVLVEGNHFVSTTMSGILLSDDAKSWYESGMCRDVTLKNNVFDYCGETPVLISPENRRHRGAVHKNITVIGNSFRKYEGVCIRIKSTDNVLIKDNSFCEGEYLKAENCSGIQAQP